MSSSQRADTLPVLSCKDILSFTFDNPSYDVDRPVFIDPGDPSSHLTHSTTQRLVRKLIAGLQAAGHRPGDVVGIHAFNSIYYPAVVMAIIGAGGISVGISPSYNHAELIHGLRIAKVRFIIAEPDVLPVLLPVLRECDKSQRPQLFVFDARQDQRVPDGFRSWRWLLDHGEKDWIRFDDEESAVDTVAQLYYTSGTTGLPKCAMVTHRNLTAQHQLCYEVNPRPYPYRVVYCLPFAHVSTMPQALISTIKEGRTAYVMRRFDLVPFLEYHTLYQVTELFLVPAIVTSILAGGFSDSGSENYRPKCSLKSVRNGTVAGAPFSGDVQRRVSQLCASDAVVTQLWGMTETTATFCMVPSDMARRDQHWGSVGLPIAFHAMKLVDERGNNVTKEGRGELCVKGPVVVKGYFDNLDATKASWDEEGYLKTGDVAQINPRTGLIHIVDRLKEMIKVQGFQVAPPELEGVLLKHPAIVAAAVIGVKNNRSEECPRAYIVLQPGVELLEADVHGWMSDRLARYKQLTGGVEFVDSLPRSPGGKILKRVLREQLRKQREVAEGVSKL